MLTDKEVRKQLSKDAKREIRDVGSFFRSLSLVDRYIWTEKLRSQPELSHINFRQMARLIWESARHH